LLFISFRLRTVLLSHELRP